MCVHTPLCPRIALQGNIKRVESTFLLQRHSTITDLGLLRQEHYACARTIESFMQLTAEFISKREELAFVSEI